MRPVADLADRHPSAQVGGMFLQSFGGVRSFCGQIVTVRLAGDNLLVRSVIDQAPAGSVVVIDGKADPICALFGDKLAALAVDRALSGVIVNGSLRDVEALARIPLGILALAAHPRRPRREGGGTIGVPVCFGGLEWSPGHWAYVDPDGILISAEALDP